MLRAVLPWLVSVTFWGALWVPTFCAAKVSFAGASFTTVPAPASSMTWGFEDALSEMVTVPATLPELCGLNATSILHCAPAATLFPQVFVWWNGLVTLSEEMDKAFDPVFVRLTVCGGLLVPTSWKG